FTSSLRLAPSSRSSSSEGHPFENHPEPVTFVDNQTVNQLISRFETLSVSSSPITHLLDQSFMMSEVKVPKLPSAQEIGTYDGKVPAERHFRRLGHTLKHINGGEQVDPSTHIYV
ncbi:hypothetical protein E4U58_001916, partial [Claviceps cyperi]